MNQSVHSSTRKINLSLSTRSRNGESEITRLIEIQTGHAVRLHAAFIDGIYVGRERQPLPSRQLDPSVSWTQTRRVYELPLGAVVQEAGLARDFEVTREGLSPIGTEAALRRLGASADVIAEYRLASRSYALRLGAKPERHRFAEPHGLSTGVQSWPIKTANSYAYVERVTAMQAWVRRPTLIEVRAAGFDVT